ncbi:MAG TPA: 7TM-DISM domain-containing protein [Fibrobacteraceae bacterium]|nr:7TM-DISM domain-containing protein [Fibrobacteraceae bacterium]
MSVRYLLIPLFFVFSSVFSETPRILRVDIHEDVSGKESFSQVQQDAQCQTSFHPVQEDISCAKRAGSQSLRWQTSFIDSIYNLTRSHSAFWYRIEIQRAEDVTAPLYLVIKSSLQDYVDVYFAGDSPEKALFMGDRRPFSARPVAFRYPVVPVDFHHTGK